MIPGTVKVVPGMVTVSVMVVMVLLPPSGGLDSEGWPGVDGEAVIGGTEVSVTVTGGSVMVTAGGQLWTVVVAEGSWRPRFLWRSARWKRPKAWAWEDAKMTARVRSEVVFA